MSYKGAYQIVDAANRGDKCYENRHGWYSHEIDASGGIDVSSIVGPFKTAADARINFVDSFNASDGDWLEV